MIDSWVWVASSASSSKRKNMKRAVVRHLSINYVDKTGFRLAPVLLLRRQGSASPRHPPPHRDNTRPPPTRPERTQCDRAIQAARTCSRHKYNAPRSAAVMRRTLTFSSNYQWNNVINRLKLQVNVPQCLGLCGRVVFKPPAGRRYTRQRFQKKKLKSRCQWAVGF